MLPRPSLRSALSLLACATALVVLPRCAGAPEPAPSEPRPSPAAPSAASPAPAPASPSASATTSLSVSPSPTTTPAPSPPPPAAVVVAFFSPGDGTDPVAYERLKAMLKTLAKVPPFVSHLWGKEGEHDECFDLSSFSPSERAAFLTRLKDFAKSSAKVTVTENGTCHAGR